VLLLLLLVVLLCRRFTSTAADLGQVRTSASSRTCCGKNWLGSLSGVLCRHDLYHHHLLVFLLLLLLLPLVLLDSR
jgi:hypothetical protein